MPHTLSTHIELPFTVAAQIHLTGVPCAPLKLLLVAEAEREPGSDTVDMPIMRARGMLGWTARTMHDSIKRLAPLQARWQDSVDDAPEATDDASKQVEDAPEATDGASKQVEDLRTIAPFSAPPCERWDGDDQRLLVRFSEDWVTAMRAPKVILPLDEVRALRRRAGLLIRLRAGAAVRAKARARLRFRAADLAMLSGREGDVGASVHMRPYIEQGIAEVSRVSSTLVLDTAHEAFTPSGYTRYLTVSVHRLDVRRSGLGRRAA